MTDTPDPRLPLRQRTSADTTDDVQRVLGKLDASGVNKKIIRVLANSPTAFRPFVLLSTGLLTSQFFPRPVQEVVILHLAARQRTQYEWEEHVPMATESGVSAEKIEAVRRDGAARDEGVFNKDELLAVAVADEILDTESLDPALWADAAALWGDEGGLDLLWTVAVWGGLVPTLIKAIGLRSIG
jgi:alkylhydroperoxidase family enzyme